MLRICLGRCGGIIISWGAGTLGVRPPAEKRHRPPAHAGRQNQTVARSEGLGGEKASHDRQWSAQRLRREGGEPTHRPGRCFRCCGREFSAGDIPFAAQILGCRRFDRKKNSKARAVLPLFPAVFWLPTARPREPVAELFGSVRRHYRLSGIGWLWDFSANH